MNPAAVPASALAALERLKPWLEIIPETARTQEWKDAKLLMELALDGRGADLVTEILYACSTVPCREPYLLRCDRPETLRLPKDWCGPCRARKFLGVQVR